MPLDKTGKKDETRQESPDKAEESKYLALTFFIVYSVIFAVGSYTPGE